MKLKNGTFEIDGISLKELAGTYGLPLFVYDSSKITTQYQRLVNAYQGVDLQINYACKALTNINVLKHLNGLGAGLDCVSVQEVELGLKAGFPAEKISYTPSGVSFEEIKKAVDKKVNITLDNLSILRQFGSEYGHTYPVSIRFNPHIMGGGNIKISTGHINSKFGISVEQIDKVKALETSLNLNIEGVHMHTGSDILDIDTFLRSADALLKAAGHFTGLKHVDFGSGFKVAYKPGDVTTDVEELGRQITAKFNKFCQEYGSRLTLMIEPGKFLVSESGFLLARVNVVKKTPAKVFAGLNTGLNHLIRPMFYDAYHHITNISHPKGAPKEYSVVGYICETDTFATDRTIAEIREGDILCFHNAGAYAYQMSSNYNSRFRPAEVLIKNQKAYLIRKRETMEDILRNQIEIEFN